ncbi:MAG: hypothetical protein AAB568_02755 [Patescibacteria group bacterium]
MLEGLNISKEVGQSVWPKEEKKPVDVRQERKNDARIREEVEKKLKRDDSYDASEEEKLKKKIEESSFNSEINRLISEEIVSHRLGNLSVIESMAILALKLEKDLLNYDTIISDDASGRLVSLFLRELVDKKRKESGKPDVQTYFISGGAEGITKKEEFLRGKKDKLGRVLLVTEYVVTGEHVGALACLLEKLGVNFDMAALSAVMPKKYGDKKIIFGSKGSVGIDLWNYPQVAGVYTKVGGIKKHVLHPRHIRHITKEDPESTVFFEQETINEARQDIKDIAQVVAEKLLK